MFPFQWLASLQDKLRTQQFRSSKIPRKQHRRFQTSFAQTSASRNVAELLEDRTLLTAFTVLNTDDSGAGSLREAIAQANANAGADSISFDAALAGQTIVLTNELEVTNDLTITGLGADRLTLDGDNNSRIFNIDDGSNVATITVEISGLTLTNGNSNETGPTPAGNGGAILSFEDLTVKNSTLRDNTARLGGGAIYASYASLTVENSLITGNTAMLHGGGGVKYHRSGGIGLIINESTFSHNSAMNGAGSGGAVNFYEGVASILNSTFTENAAVASGGAVYNNVGSMTIESSTLTKNVSGNNGGAIKNSNELFVYNSTLSQNNTRHFGAGIISSTNTTLEVVNSTIVLNYTRSASSQGGAIYGGNSKSFTIKNSIIAANTAANNVQITGLYTDTSNIISGSISGLIDPVLRDNGGPTNTHALLLGSAAINAGNNTATTNAGLATDQRGTGFTRIVDGTVDIGAVEFQLSYFLVDINSDLDDGDYSLGQLSLREAIKLANASSSVNTIIFDPSLAGQTIILNSELVISDDLTLTGLGAGQLTIDGNNTSRIFLIYDGDLEITRTVEISGLTLTNGNTIDKGGAILNYEDLIIKDSIVTGNTARLGGGGIYSSFVSLTIENSLITENTATFHGGGGIKYFKSGGSGLSIVDSIFSLNSAEGGSTGQGGAVYFYEGVASILNSTFTDNSSEGDGGAINNNISGSMTIDSSTFTENVSSTHGGAISNWNELFVHNSTLSNNTTHLWGAGIFSNSATALEIVNSTIVLNQATSPTSRSGAIYWTDSSPFKIANSIIAANTSANAHQIDGPYTTISNIVSDSLSGLIDPVLRDNGGPTKTHALVSGSAAINAGNNTEVTNAGLTTEQRGTGFSRIIDGTVDIGAVETQLSYLLVDTNSDLDDGDYSFGQLSLREAIKLANASSTVNTIIFDVSLSGQTILLNSELLISDDLTITGLGRDQLTLDANKTSRIFNIDDGNIATTIIVEITGLTLTNGETKSTGGAILSSEDLTVKDSTLRGNSARFGGGGIYSSLSSLAIVNSLITENSALFQGGGGVMYFRSGGTGLLVNESTFSLNSAVGSNTGQGGAIYFYEGIASILNSTFTENSGEINGGAIHNSYSGSMSVDSSTFTQNTASEQYGTGGAIYNENELFVTNSTLSGNRADFLGGGIYTFRHTTLEIVNSTIVANQATSSVSRGGGIYSTIPNSIQLTNSIVAGNTAVNHPQIDADYVGTNNIISSSIAGLIDPVLRDNGGPTKTHALLVGSAAINAGDNTAATNAGLTTDQRGTGFARIVDSTVDIGAVEASSLHFLVDTHSDLDDGDYSDGELSLREAIKLANASAGADTITFDVALAGQSIIIGTELRISDNLIISGLGAEQLTLDGNGDSRIFNVYSDNNGITAEIEISGLTLTNGYANSGGAIQSTENLTLLDMIITDNEADVQGGGLRNASAGILTVTNSQITENRALRGGGIYSQFSTLIITASTISNNESTKDGGGIHYTHSDLYGNSPSMIIDSTISDNIAGTNGGGIYNSRGHLQVNHSTFSRNAAILGGGLYSIGNADGGIVSVTDSTFSENTQVESGGGIYSENTILTVDGSTFSDNAATKFNYAGKGGGIFNLGGALTVTDTDFTRNSAVLKGGGIYNYSSDMFHVSRSTFSHNSAQQAAGVFNYNTAMNVMESSFLENKALPRTGAIALAHYGGGILHDVDNRLEEVFEVIISNSQFYRNTAQIAGGGIYLSGGMMTITGSTFSENNGGGNGGGVYNILGTLTVEESTFSQNEASSHGGGIENVGTLSIFDSTFAENITGIQGGAIYNNQIGTASIFNSTISGNHSSSQGGGIYSISESPLTVLNSTITGNSAANQGGGIYSNNVTPTITNSIVAGNTANESPQIYGSFTNNTSIVQDSIEGLLDPILRDNAGPTQTHALLLGSAAINAGDNTAAIDAGLNNDQRGDGFNRILEHTIDIGAIEFQGPFTRIHLHVVSSETSTESNGETNSLPNNLTWIDEWSGYWLEIWVSTSTTDLGILSAALNLSYNTAITTATSIEYGAAFTLNQTGTINDLTGTIEDLSAATTLTDVGDDRSVLFARIKFESTVDDAVDLDLAGQSLNPQSPGFEINHPEILLTGSVASEEVYGLSPSTQIWANPYDLNDDDVINFRDLILFASAYRSIPSESSSDYSWFADYNQSDRVGFRDLILFASNYSKSKANQSTITYAHQFPDAWNQLLTVETQHQPQTIARPVLQSTADTVLNSVVAQVSPQLSPSENKTLENIDIQVVDLAGDTLGRAVPGTIYIDVNAAGHGWFVDATPDDHNEFTFSSELTLIALPGSEAADGLDLWTVILHELGHLLGHEHEGTGVMQETLDPGVRNLSDWEEDTDSFFIELTDDSYLIEF